VTSSDSSVPISCSLRTAVISRPMPTCRKPLTAMPIDTKAM